RLDYLDSLGVTLVYFNPVFYAASLHKYDAASYHHVDPYFGPDPDGDLAQIARETADPATWRWTAADSLFLDLLDAFHARGIRVVLDGVFNHTGTRFWAFESVRREQQASPYADWYEVTRWDDPATPATSEFDWNGWWGFKPLPVLANNADSTSLHPAIQAHVFDVTRRWMDPDGDGDPADGIDGWRLDVAGEVPDGFWRAWTALVGQLNPDAYTVAEEWGDASGYLARTGFQSTMNYHAVAIPADDFLFDGRVGAETFARETIRRFEAYPEATRFGLLNLTASHDTDRLPSMIVNGTLGANYDRDASPRQTDRYSVRAPNAAEREVQRLVVTLQMALPGLPMVYYGDEVGMWGADDPDDRKPMVWPDLAYEPESRDPLGRPRTTDPVAFDSTLFRFYQSVIALRRGDAVLRSGDLRVLAADSAAQSVAFERALGAERRVVALNRSDRSQFLAFPEGAPRTPLVPIFASTGDVADVASLVFVLEEDGGSAVGLRLPPRTAVVFRPAEGPDVRPHGLHE
ncbi:MAG TPA: alpha-amylase family glycosyl hydrolase, partial [Rubricoccaceae bacterium]